MGSRRGTLMAFRLGRCASIRPDPPLGASVRAPTHGGFGRLACRGARRPTSSSVWTGLCLDDLACAHPLSCNRADGWLCDRPCPGGSGATCDCPARARSARGPGVGHMGRRASGRDPGRDEGRARPVHRLAEPAVVGRPCRFLRANARAYRGRRGAGRGSPDARRTERPRGVRPRVAFAPCRGGFSRHAPAVPSVRMGRGSLSRAAASVALRRRSIGGPPTPILGHVHSCGCRRRGSIASCSENVSDPQGCGRGLGWGVHARNRQPGRFRVAGQALTNSRRAACARA